uniref:ribonuclease H n=1 Tax=Chrysemys picta bellii TaxID=8478 RepID=A0A8C3F354_CHRPI
MTALREQGIIVPCSSPCNIPIFPVRKADGKSCRFVQDLRPINRIVIPAFPVVPNPATILASIPPGATHFTVVDLCSAFFSVPVHPDSQYLFAFSYKGQQYTWTMLPQGYTESPSYFSQALARDLADLVFPSRSTLVQYVDDLLLCSPSLSASETDSLVPLTALAKKGHKASRSKLQFCQASVTYLGFLLSQGSRTLSPTRVQAILSFPRPCSPCQVREFLDMAGFCRQWIPQYASLAKPP